MDSWFRDVRQAGRRLRASPGFAAAAVLTLALGIGANTAIFSIVNTVLWQRQPFTGPEGLYQSSRWSITAAELPLLASGETGAFTDAAIFRTLRGNLYGGGRAETVVGEIVSGNYFRLLGLAPVRGRLLDPSDDHGPPAAVISASSWRSQFSAREDIVGLPARLNGRTLTIVGVAPDGFRGLFMPGLIQEQVWVSLSFEDAGQDSARGSDPHFDVVLRVHDGVSAGEAEAALNVLAPRLPRLAERRPQWLSLRPLATNRLDSGAAAVATPMATGLLLMVALVLVVACANLANMVMARGATRGGELALRHALGASRARLVRQLMAENVLLAGLGGSVAVLMTLWVSGVLGRLNPPMLEAVRIAVEPVVDWRVLCYALGVTIATVLTFGLVPSIRAARAGFSPLVPGTVVVPGGGSRWFSARNLLIVAQVSTSAVLLVAAALLARSYVRAAAVDPGFREEGLAKIGVDVGPRAREESSGREFQARVQQHAASVPGVVAVTLADKLPAGGPPSTSAVWLDGEARDAGTSRRTSYVRVGPAFFGMLDIPIVEGRAFRHADGPGSARVVVVNEYMARHVWRGRSPIGERVWLGGASAPDEPLTVVGVAGDTGMGMLGNRTTALAYLPAAQHYHPRMEIIALTRGDERALVGELRRVVREIDPDVMVLQANTVREHLAVFKYPFRLAAGIVGTLGLLAALLAALGLYGVMAYLVSQRTREVGVRLALGGTPRDVLGLVVWQGMRVVALGIGLGGLLAIPAAIALTRVLYGISAIDPLAFAGVPALLLAIGLVACVVPGRRAARVNPVVALRSL